MFSYVRDGIANAVMAEWMSVNLKDFALPNDCRPSVLNKVKRVYIIYA